MSASGGVAEVGFQGGHFAFWHETDMPGRADEVRSWEQSRPRV